MSWPPSPLVIVLAYVLLVACLATLLLLVGHQLERARQRRSGDPQPPVTFADWLNEPLQPWPGREVEASIAARQTEHALIRKAQR